MGATVGTARLGTVRLANGTLAPANFGTEMRRRLGSRPLTKVLFVKVDGTEVDISSRYLAGATFEQVKERAPDEISAGDFDIVLANNDNYFSEYVVGALLENIQYHGAKIKIYQGFTLPDGTEQYEIQAVGLIDEIKTSPSESTVTFRCRDRVRRILDEALNPSYYELIAQRSVGSVGNGQCTNVSTKPFKTVTETWTLTCTLAGADGVAHFSVVGSASGNVGTATSGTEFSTGTGAGGVKFTITGGGTNWALGDVFTFQTKQHPQWSVVNAGKIIWSILTGYNWDSNTAENWSSHVLSFDHTQSDANTDLDYLSFSSGITQLSTFANFNLTGYVGFDESAVDFLQGILLLFLGSLYTGSDGRIKLGVYVPGSTPTVVADFADANKITSLGYSRTQDEVINHVAVEYKARAVWQFTDEDFTYDGRYVAASTASKAKYNTLKVNFAVRWYSANGNHVIDFADKLLGKYQDPPLNIDFETGMDALRTEIGDAVTVTDEKYGLFQVRGEVTRVTKYLDRQPATISLRVRRESDLAQTWGYIGSEVDEGDGISPQPDSWDSATTAQKHFAYLSQSGDSTVDYRLF